MAGLDTYVRARIDLGIRTTLDETPFPYDDDSTLEQMGMDYIAAANFLMDLEDELKINFDPLIKPLQDAASERARLEQEKSKESHWFAPDIEEQEKYLRIGQIVGYIQEQASQSAA